MEKPLTLKQAWMLLGIGALLGSSLSMGFLPTVMQLLAPWFQRWGPHLSAEWRAGIGFVLLAAIFASTTRGLPPQRGPTWPLLWLPWILALIIGAGGPTFQTAREQHGDVLLWVALFAPLGEELLFRGWLQNLALRLFGKRPLTATNPLPAGIWLSAIAFSLWHLQNYPATPWFWVQVLYTLPLGLWFGLLKYRTGTLWLPVLAHCGLNIAGWMW